MTLPPTLTLTYWFNPSPTPLMPVMEWVLLIGFSVLAVLGIVAHIYRAKCNWGKLERRALGRSGTALITMGLCGLALYGFYYEKIMFFSMRFWYVVWLACSLAWAWSIYRYATVTIPEYHKKHAIREQFEKWLPKKR